MGTDEPNTDAGSLNFVVSHFL